VSTVYFVICSGGFWHGGLPCASPLHPSLTRKSLASPFFTKRPLILCTLAFTSVHGSLYLLSFTMSFMSSSFPIRGRMASTYPTCSSHILLPAACSRFLHRPAVVSSVYPALTSSLDPWQGCSVQFRPFSDVLSRSYHGFLYV
jgi:hypothetical protein